MERLVAADTSAVGAVVDASKLGDGRVDHGLDARVVGDVCHLRKHLDVGELGGELLGEGGEEGLVGVRDGKARDSGEEELACCSGPDLEEEGRG